MNISVHIDTAGLEAKLSQLPEVCERAAAMALNDTANEIRNAAIEKAPSDTSNLREHITVEEATPGNLEATVSADTDYAAAVEKGSRPHFPPPAALEGWARRHGAANPKAAAFLIARAISKRGTEAQPFFEPAVDQYVPGRLMSRMTSAIEAALGSL